MNLDRNVDFPRHVRMPTYSYQCDDCSHAYEAFQKMTEDPHTVCPECKGRVQRLIGAGAGIVFKGSGFYVTDYKKPSSGGAESKSESKSESSGKSESSKSESSGKSESSKSESSAKSEGSASKA